MSEAPSYRPTRTGRMAWLVAAILAVAIAIVSYRYLPGVGPRPPAILGNSFANPFLKLHVAGAATALLVVCFQFLPGLRARRPKLHRWVGRIYVMGCLVGAIAGLVIATGSTAGPIAGLGFGSLAVAWFITTAQGWRTAMQRRFVAHRAWMIRSAALTFAAVTLRLYLPLFAVAGVDFLTGYRAVSYLCWIPNLILAELYLRGKLRLAGLARVQTAFA